MEHLSEAALRRADLSSFPVLRIDQISVIDTDTLASANREAADLLSGLLEEHLSLRAQSRDPTTVPRPQLAVYLEMQIESVNKELLSRAAEQRINEMLRNVSDCETKSAKQFFASKTTKSPLPIIFSHTAPNLSAKSMNSYYTPQANHPNLSAFKSTTSKSESSIHQDSDADSESSAPLLRRSRQLRSTQPVKKASEDLNKNFGNVFMVAATEKKVRFYPKKATVESVEEVKEKERAERRKLAMKRLLERREKREEQLQKQHLKKRIIKLTRLKHNASNTIVSNTGLVDFATDISSDSESVSGGDDDFADVELDQAAVLMMEKSLDEVPALLGSTIILDTDPKYVNIDFSLKEDQVMSTGKPIIEEVVLQTTVDLKENEAESSEALPVEGALNDTLLMKEGVRVSEEPTVEALSFVNQSVELLCNDHCSYRNNDLCGVVIAESERTCIADEVTYQVRPNEVLKKENLEESETGEILNSNQADADVETCNIISNAYDKDIELPSNVVFHSEEAQINAILAPVCITSSSQSSSDSVSISDVLVEYQPSTNKSLAHKKPIQKVKSSKPSPLYTQIKAPLAVKSALSEIYPHIGSIFPVLSGLTVNNRADELTARTLLESMHLQCRLYSEWTAVMRDYATVFSVESDTTSAASKSVYAGNPKALHYRVKSSRPEVGNIITDVLASLGGTERPWFELPPGLGLGVSWNLLWTWSKPHINTAHLLTWQRVNHFEDGRFLTRKDMLKKSLQRLVDYGGKTAEAFEIMPLTFVLPHEYTQFVSAFKLREEASTDDKKKNNYWIMKPVGLSRGRGISLVKDLESVTYSQASVIQRYVDDPLCLAGYKFDLRLYVLVTSFQPLEAFLYNDGFARLSTQVYSTSEDLIDNKFIHLTNSSIQKYNTDAVAADNPLNENSSDVGGSKICLQGPGGLWRRLQGFGVNTEDLWEKIISLVLKSLVAVDDRIRHQPCSFEVFGYDVLFDSKLTPWLLEVNASPSLARENHIDHRIKDAMIKDTILLVDPAPYDRAALARVLERRLQEIGKSKALHTSSRGDALLDADLTDILGDYVPRRYGEIPKRLGGYERIAPGTKAYESIVKLKAKLIKPVL